MSEDGYSLLEALVLAILLVLGHGSSCKRYRRLPNYWHF
jgi:hypothetical protein